MHTLRSISVMQSFCLTTHMMEDRPLILMVVRATECPAQRIRAVVVPVFRPHSRRRTSKTDQLGRACGLSSDLRPEWNIPPARIDPQRDTEACTSKQLRCSGKIDVLTKQLSQDSCILNCFKISLRGCAYDGNCRAANMAQQEDMVASIVALISSF